MKRETGREGDSDVASELCQIKLQPILTFWTSAMRAIDCSFGMPWNSSTLMTMRGSVEPVREGGGRQHVDGKCQTE